MTDEELEAPAYLGREFPTVAAARRGPPARGQRLDSMEVLDLISSDHHRDLTLGYLVMLSAILAMAALVYAGDGLWVHATVCGVAGALCAYGTVRRARRRVREEMLLTGSEPQTEPGSAPG